VTSPAPVLPRATVVICVYTEKRWDDIVAAVGSVLDQDVRAADRAGRPGRVRTDRPGPAA